MLNDTGLGRATWHFDAKAELIGATFLSDTGEMCHEGSTAFSFRYGESCPNEGEGESLCTGAGGAGGAGGTGGTAG